MKMHELLAEMQRLTAWLTEAPIDLTWPSLLGETLAEVVTPATGHTADTPTDIHEAVSRLEVSQAVRAATNDLNGTARPPESPAFHLEEPHRAATRMLNGDAAGTPSLLPHSESSSRPTVGDLPPTVTTRPELTVSPPSLVSSWFSRLDEYTLSARQSPTPTEATPPSPRSVALPHSQPTPSTSNWPETPSTPDLPQLAAMLKQLLDDEARRYGIDV